MPYVGVGPNKGKKISTENALSYAMYRCGIQFVGGPSETDTAEFTEMFVNWFYSGDWRREED